MSGSRHATMDELLAQRDGEGSGWTAAHLTACAACDAELRRLEQLRARLRALPAYAPPRDRWPLVAAQARRERRQRWMRAAAGLATAAALTALTFVALRPPQTDVAAERAELERAMTRSQALEQALKSLGPEHRALNGEAAFAAAELQDRLRQLDVEIASPDLQRRDQALNLWRERAGVLSALVDVHVTRAAAAGL